MAEPRKLEECDAEQTLEFVVQALRRTILHYGIWFNETVHQLGLEQALKAEEETAGILLPIIIKRMCGTLGVETAKSGLPAALTKLPKEKLVTLADAMSANWLASDGVWFQAVERRRGMNDAKRVNDSCWTRFSPVEAQMVKSLLKLPENPGLEGLERALAFRLYSRINVQTVTREENAVVLKMINCRVQEARKRKGLADYPCKSAGLVEYEAFARTIDPRLRTTCVACPPDDHPSDWSCAWRFELS
jgi:hypothetical protein